MSCKPTLLPRSQSPRTHFAIVHLQKGPVKKSYVFKVSSSEVETWERGGTIESDLRIGSVVIDCINFDGMLAFWQEALHYVPRNPAKNGWVVLRDPAGRNTNVSLNQVSVSEKLTGRNWLHFDLYTMNQKGEIERLIKLGASRHPQTYEPDDDFVVLKDPDGNLFCVIDIAKG